MKITNSMFANGKAMVAKLFTVGLLAGAVVLAAPTKAEAQWGVGVRIGPAPYRGPVVVAHGPVYGGFYGRPFYGPRFGWDHREFYHDRRFYR